jgi:putative nucleotidyltransferase with HDIG domain
MGVAAILVALLCVAPFVATRLPLQQDGTALSNIVARHAIVYVDSARTEELRKRAMAEVAPIYKFDSAVLSTAVSAFDEATTGIMSLRSQDLLVDEASRAVAQLLDTTPSASVRYLVTCSESELQSLKTAAREALTAVMSRGVLEENTAAAREAINSELKRYGISESQVSSAYLLATPFIVVNLRYDQESTQVARERAADLVAPVVSTIARGTVIVEAGAPVDDTMRAFLVSTGVAWGRKAVTNLLSILVIVMLALFGLICAVVSETTVPVKRQRLLLETAVIGVTCLSISSLTGGLAPFLTPFFLPLLLGFVFFDGRLGPIFGLCMIVLSVVIVPLPVELAVGLIAGTLAIAIIMQRFNRVTTILAAGPVAGIVAAVFYWGLAGLNPQSLATTGVNAGYVVGGGVIAAAFALGLTLIFERLFNVATVMRLRELLDTGSRLLGQLFESAPGTYHHSLSVANLAAGAAQRIGANWLLTRVGGYYHDIGKLLHPQFFGENRGELPDIHEEITPELSTKVILEHVQAGAAIARANRLPQDIVDIVAEHHGTSVVQFFYDKAAAERANLSPDAFRYQGPKPHTRESSLVFLADGVEAAARSLSHVDRPALEGLIDSITAARVADGQLAESSLTLSEIATAKEYFLASLLSFYHVRDAYPSTEEASETP